MNLIAMGRPATAPPIASVNGIGEHRSSVAVMAARFFPRQPETIAAVTGTSGKTSVAAFTRQIWESLGHASASIGTIGLVSPKRTVYGSLTTPDPIALHRRDRLWIVAHASCERYEQITGSISDLFSEPANKIVGCDGQGALVPDAASEQVGIAGQSRINQGMVSDAMRERRQQITGSAFGDEGTNEGRTSQDNHVFASVGQGVPDTTPMLQARGPMADTNGTGSQGHGRPAERPGEWLAWTGGQPLEGIWLTEPDMGRVASGIPKRVDRLRGLGNAIVPQVAFIFIEAIAQEIKICG
jgi:hypothetical protein